MMEDSDILTLGWGCEPASNLWHHAGEEFVTLDVEDTKESHDFATLEVAKERDRQFYNNCVDTDKIHQDWDILRLDETAHLLQQTPRILPAPTPIHPAPPPLPAQTIPPVSVTEFYVDSFHSPAGYPANLNPTYSHSPHPGVGVVYQQHQEPYQPHATYQQQLSHPSFAYTSFVTDPNKRHTVRSPVSGKFVRTGPLVPQKRHDMTKERKRPGPKAKAKPESEAKPPEEPEYAPEVIANAHLTMDDDYYVCSVCSMKFKQPGNARRHIITVHRNEKNHECIKCQAKFGRKDKLKTHMMRNHGFTADDIKATFKHSGQGRQRSSILVNRDNRRSTESSNSSDTEESNPLNLKTSGKKKHSNPAKRRKV